MMPYPYHVMAKPTGAICNLDCAYCFFLSKEELYPESNFHMSDDVLKSYLKQYIQSQPRVAEIMVTWQGGEPTLMGLDFFEKATRFANQFKAPGQRVSFAIQTNGILLDDAWGQFLHDNRYLVGISIDGTEDLHNIYRRDKGGKPTFKSVLTGLNILKKHKVDFNILCTVNAANANHPLEVYRFFRDELKAEYIQFISIVERKNKTGFQEGEQVTERSVRPEEWGIFLKKVFDEWITQDVGRVFIPTFESALANFYGVPAGICIFNSTCGLALALEHNGDLYACDHYVEPKYLLGNIQEIPMEKLVRSEKQDSFGQAKKDALPQYCLDCDVLFACHGECPKNRFHKTPDGETGLNYLCEGYKIFFRHIDKPMKFMANELRHQRSPARVMKYFGQKS
ncbi:MAG: anaerobic sulfatase maturase [Anaerolineae bacterium]|jgi:uncharacterized protein|nr:anaerobic sulfatase maturase [Anaerolineae bacterium]MBT3714857.1 anaerobic sulfatase maturase [Anaerolineae bacterium]MBT4311864.1 anaerobic sulfatase maturase [Anaerolineae bacterium]MBT4458068.1 anaerobic sulfatase maturase [Anaerolineae bacterium]MBT4842510.1 anaerobic sulfatase maturase [Anaerolineae bacterium]